MTFAANSSSTSTFNEQEQIIIFTLIFPSLTTLGNYKTNGQEAKDGKPWAMAPKTL